MAIDSPGGSGTAQPPPVKPKLLHLVRQAIRIRHYSPRTEQAYVHCLVLELAVAAECKTVVKYNVGDFRGAEGLAVQAQRPADFLRAIGVLS